MMNRSEVTENGGDLMACPAQQGELNVNGKLLFDAQCESVRNDFIGCRDDHSSR